MRKLFLLSVILISSIFAQKIISPGELVQKAKSQIKEIKSQKLYTMFDENILIIDIREPHETHLGKIDYGNVINIPRGLLEFKIAKHNLEKYDAVIVYCQAGARGALATLRLQNMGYKNIYNLIGGFKEWDEQCGPSLEFNDLYFIEPDTKKEPISNKEECIR
jgi:rhodanese-related sulfurtransferase